jgi:hypothetical protein
MMFNYEGEAILVCPDGRKVPVRVRLQEFCDQRGLRSWGGMAWCRDGHAISHAMMTQNLRVQLPDGREGKAFIRRLNVNGANTGTAAIQGQHEPPALAA